MVGQNPSRKTITIVLQALGRAPGLRTRLGGVEEECRGVLGQAPGSGGSGGLGQARLAHPLAGQGVDQSSEAEGVDLLARPADAVRPVVAVQAIFV
jgi:hypothetical protein